MSKAKEAKEENALTVNNAEQLKQIEAELFARSDTDDKLMEMKRRSVSYQSMKAAALLAMMDDMEAKDPKASETPTYQALANKYLMINSQAMLMGLEFMCDALSYRTEVIVETPKGERKDGFARKTTADTMDELAATVCDEHNGMAVMLGSVAGMLNDIGNHFKCFLDQHGVHNPKKYVIEEDPDKDKKKVVSAAEAVVDEE